MVGCLTKSLLELKLVNGSREVPAGRRRGGIVRGQIPNVPNLSIFAEAAQGSALFYE